MLQYDLARYRLHITYWGCWCRDVTLGARQQAFNPSALIVHSEPTGCHVSGLMWMAGHQTPRHLQTGVSGAIVEWRNVTTQPTCQPLASVSGPLLELVRVLARDSECAVSPVSKPSGVVGTGTLQLFMKTHYWKLIEKNRVNPDGNSSAVLLNTQSYLACCKSNFQG